MRKGRQKAQKPMHYPKLLDVIVLATLDLSFDRRKVHRTLNDIQVIGNRGRVDRKVEKAIFVTPGRKTRDSEV
jgi:hypothetical protein